MEALHVQAPVIAATEPPLRLLLLEKSLADSQDILEELRAAGMAIEPTVVATRDEFLDTISHRISRSSFPSLTFRSGAASTPFTNFARAVGQRRSSSLPAFSGKTPPPNA